MTNKFELSPEQVKAVFMAMQRHYPDGAVPEDHIMAVIDRVTEGLIDGAMSCGILEGRITCRWDSDLDDMVLWSADTLVVPE